VRALNPICELEPGARPRDWMDSTQSAASANDGSSGARFDCALSADEHALATLARLNPDEHALAPLNPDGHALARWDAGAAPAELEQRR
jgi:hypothetical protein